MNITRIRLLKLGLLLVVGILFFYYLLFLHLIKVPTGSMANTVIPGDHLVVKKRAFGEISRGDLIVFTYPRDLSVHYLSRIIGLPGESIEVRGRFVYVNGAELPEQRVAVKPDNLDDPLDVGVLEELSTEGKGPYRVFYFSREEGDKFGMANPGTFGTDGPFQIPANEYFVMGDNRDNSEDSRYKGTVPRSLIFGKPTMIYWSAGGDKTGNQTVRWERIFKQIK